MRIADFSVEIPQGREFDSGYVAMRHNTKYAIRLSNFSDLRCDAEVEIDGKLVGIWRVPSEQSIVVERPVHDTGCFTFYKTGTLESGKAAIVRSDKLGLISVLFKPEEEQADFFDFDLDYLDEALEVGGTGLPGKSEQTFNIVQPLDYDEAGFVRIHLRLGCEADELRPLMPVSTPVPPPLL